MSKFILKVAVCSFLTFISIHSSGQDSTRQDSLYNQLFYQNSNRYCFSCGNFGIDSDNLRQFSELIAGRRFDLVEKLLHSELPSTQYFAAEIILFVNKKKFWQSDDSIFSRIEQLRTSEERVGFESGCVMMGNSYSIESLLAQKKDVPYYKFIRSWIKRKFKYY